MNKDAYITGSDIILHAIMCRLQAERIMKLRSAWTFSLKLSKISVIKIKTFQFSSAKTKTKDYKNVHVGNCVAFRWRTAVLTVLLSEAFCLALVLRSHVPRHLLSREQGRNFHLKSGGRKTVPATRIVHASFLRKC